jgi:type I restriction enzyme, S subunit
MSLPELRPPKGWTAAQLGQFTGHRGETVNPAGTPEQTYELYSVPSLEAGRPEVVLGASIGSSKQKVEPQSVLLCKINPRINRVWVVGEFTEHPKIASTEWIVFPRAADLLPKFLKYFLQQNTVRDFLAQNASGVGGSLMRVKASTLAGFPFHYPHHSQQLRIVARIEELFSELDKGIQNLKQARAQLAVYRQALLKHAFEGELTAKWRAKHVTPLQTRREGPDDRISQSQAAWSWQNLASISVVSGGLTKNPDRESLPRKMKYLRVANVYANRLDLDDVREIGVTNEEAQRLTLKKGDLLVVEGNGSVEQIGRVAEWTGSIPDCGHQNHLIRARLGASILPRFVLRFLQSPRGRDAIVKAASSTSGLHTLSISKVGSLTIPVAPFSEQEALLSLLEPALDHVDVLQCDIDTNLQKAEALRQSILKKAFAGELVPQDPADEPATALLARIRLSRQSQAAADAERATHATASGAKKNPATRRSPSAKSAKSAVAPLNP